MLSTGITLHDHFMVCYRTNIQTHFECKSPYSNLFKYRYALLADTRLYLVNICFFPLVTLTFPYADNRMQTLHSITWVNTFGVISSFSWMGFHKVETVLKENNNKTPYCFFVQVFVQVCFHDQIVNELKKKKGLPVFFVFFKEINAFI